MEMLTEIEARLDFDDELPLLDPVVLINQIDDMWNFLQQAMDTANYDKLLQTGLQVHSMRACFSSVVNNTILMLSDLTVFLGLSFQVLHL